MLEIDITKFKNQLGANYFLVEIIWDEICKNGFVMHPAESLNRNESPVDECTELEKILLTCITYIQDEEEKNILNASLLATIYKNHKITPGTKITIKSFFFIVLE